jgi:hypothetical protein
MAKLILNNLNLNTNKTDSLSARFTSDRTKQKQRSKKYLDLITGLDAKTITDTAGMQQLLSAIHEEFGTANTASIPLGIVGKCFLGHPHEVHILDFAGTHIIRHYKIGEPMPPDFEKARSLAIHNAYLFVEVYTDKLIPIRGEDDGIGVAL